MRRLFLAASAVLASSVAASAQPTIDSHVNAARAAVANTRWASTVDGLCRVSTAPRPPRAPRGPLPVTLPETPNWPEEPAKIFDHFYFVGSKGVSAFAIDTPDGIIVTDSMWAYDVEKSVAGGLTKLGLDPQRIRYVIIPHGHPDHFGGAQFLHNAFGAKIVAPKGDLELIKHGPEYDTTPIPKGYDLLVGDGDTLSLGGVTVTFTVMPGHTPGGVVMDFPVTDKGAPHRMLIWSAGEDTPGSPDGQKQQAAAIAKLISRAKATGMDAVGDNHGSHLLADAMRTDPKAGNPFLVGRAALTGYLTARMECDEARLAASSSSK